MEKKQYELCLEVLRRFHKHKLLNECILIGSWCMLFYEQYFQNPSLIAGAVLKTRDMDFLIHNPANLKTEVDIPELLKDLGFVTSFLGTKGYIQLNHPDLILEFLVPEKGRGLNKPYPLPELGLNATPLRFLNYLTDQIVKIKFKDITVNIPHPARFALHKLIIHQRRKNQEKAAKDKHAAMAILNALMDNGKGKDIKEAFSSAPEKWQKKILKALKVTEEQKILELLEF